MEEIDLVEMLKAFWRRKLQIILIILIFIEIGYIYTTKYVTPMYSTKTTLVLASQEGDTTNTASIASDVTVNTKLVSTYSELIKSKNVLSDVISNLGVDITVEKLRNSINVSAVSNTALIDINVTNEEAENTAKIANEIANVFTKKISEIYNINNVQIVNEATVPTSPSNIHHKKDILMFALIGVVMAAGYVFIASMLDNTIKSSEEIERMINLPILVSIPMYDSKKEKGGKKRR